MGVFQRKASTSSIASQPGASSSVSSSKPKPPSRSNTSSSIKPVRPSITQRVTSSVKPRPKPQPSLLRRATTGLTEVSTTRWEKRMLKRIEDFPKDHPLLAKLIGAGLCVVGAGAGAVTVPAIAAALGLKIAVTGAGAVVGTASIASFAATGVAAQGTAVAAAAAAAGKLLLSSAALDLGGRLLTSSSNETKPRGFFGFGKRKDSGDGLSLLPLKNRD